MPKATLKFAQSMRELDALLPFKGIGVTVSNSAGDPAFDVTMVDLGVLSKLSLKITPTAIDSNVYKGTFYHRGLPYDISVTSDATATVAEVCALIAAKIEAVINSGDALVTVTDNATDVDVDSLFDGMAFGISYNDCTVAVTTALDTIDRTLVKLWVRNTHASHDITVKQANKSIMVVPAASTIFEFIDPFGGDLSFFSDTDSPGFDCFITCPTESSRP